VKIGSKDYNSRFWQRENERDLFLKEKCIDIYHERLQSAKKITEGFAVKFMIADKSDFTGVESLLRILMSLRNR
jgi:hypothetical protein